MPQMLLWPTLLVLGGTAATIPAIQNSNMRNLLYWLVLSPMAMGLVCVAFLGGIR